jgi:hypothetical protein
MAHKSPGIMEEQKNSVACKDARKNIDNAVWMQRLGKGNDG